MLSPLTKASPQATCFPRSLRLTALTTILPPVPCPLRNITLSSLTKTVREATAQNTTLTTRIAIPMTTAMIIQEALLDKEKLTIVLANPLA